MYDSSSSAVARFSDLDLAKSLISASRVDLETICTELKQAVGTPLTVKGLASCEPGLVLPPVLGGCADAWAVVWAVLAGVCSCPAGCWLVAWPVLTGVCTGPACAWVVVVLMTGVTVAEDGVVVVIGVVECVLATVVEACISALHVGVTGFRGSTLAAGLSWLLSLSSACSILKSRSLS